MPLYAKLRLGPSDQPNGYAYVELLTQCNEVPFGRIRCRLLHTNQVVDIYENQLELKWLEPLKENVQS